LDYKKVAELLKLKQEMKVKLGLELAVEQEFVEVE
jgi:hypothetical protein